MPRKRTELGWLGAAVRPAPVTTLCTFRLTPPDLLRTASLSPQGAGSYLIARIARICSATEHRAGPGPLLPGEKTVLKK